MKCGCQVSFVNNWIDVVQFSEERIGRRNDFWGERL